MWRTHDTQLDTALVDKLEKLMVTDYSIPLGDFYRHYNLSKTDVYGSLTVTTKTGTLTIDGKTYEITLTEK